MHDEKFISSYLNASISSEQDAGVQGSILIKRIHMDQACPD